MERKRNSSIFKFQKPETVSEFQEMNERIYSEANERYDDGDLVRRLLEEICAMIALAH